MFVASDGFCYFYFNAFSLFSLCVRCAEKEMCPWVSVCFSFAFRPHKVGANKNNQNTTRRHVSFISFIWSFNSHDKRRNLRQLTWKSTNVNAYSCSHDWKFDSTTREHRTCNNKKSEGQLDLCDLFSFSLSCSSWTVNCMDSLWVLHTWRCFAHSSLMCACVSVRTKPFVWRVLFAVANKFEYNYTSSTYFCNANAHPRYADRMKRKEHWTTR